MKSEVNALEEPLILEGRVWVFGDDMSTDLIWPTFLLKVPRAERVHHVFSANRPGWADQVTKGDIIVAGRNFGIGSSRPAVQVMRDLGISCLLAESIGGLFFRNCVNYGLPALELAGVHAAFREGDVAQVEFTAGRARNVRTDARLACQPWPAELLEILCAGGLVSLMEQKGMLEDAAKLLATKGENFS